MEKRGLVILFIFVLLDFTFVSGQALPEEGGGVEEIEGTLEVLHKDNFQDRIAQYDYYLRTDEGKRYRLSSLEHFPFFRSGVKIKLKGNINGETIYTRPDSVQIVQPIGEGGGGFLGRRFLDNFGEQKTLAILVDIGDFKVPFTPTQVKNILFGEDFKSVNDFTKKNSYGQAYLSGDVYGPYYFEMPLLIDDNNDCPIISPEEILLRAKGDIIEFGRKLSDYSRVILFFHQRACEDRGIAGWGTVGKNTYLLDGGELSFSISSIFSNPLDKLGGLLSVLYHEFGHNFGVHHANSFLCLDSEGRFIPFSYDCGSDEYGDPVSLMGWSVNFHNHAAHKWDIGWLGADRVATVPREALQTEDFQQWEYDLRPLEVDILSGIQMIRIPLQTGIAYYGIDKDLYYTIDFRQPLDYDAELGRYDATQGVFVRLAMFKEESAIQTQLLGYEPTENYFFARDVLLRVGKSFVDEINGFRISVDGIDGNGKEAVAKVRIEKIPRKKIVADFSQPLVIYHFDDEGLDELLKKKGEGVFVRDSGGYLFGGRVVGSEYSYPQYKLGGLYFHEDIVPEDEQHGYVSIPVYPIPAAFIQENKAFTLSVWVNPQNYPSPRGVIFSSSFGIIFIDSKGIVQFNTFGGPLFTKGPISLNEWHHILAVYDVKQARLYVDGVKSDSVDFLLEEYYLGASRGLIGGDKLGSSSEVIIDEFKIYARALNDIEVKELYKSFRPLVEERFLRGDSNNDEEVDLSDAVFILQYLFQDGNYPPCFDAADVNDDGTIDIADPIKLLFALFQGGSIPEPFSSLGYDLTEDSFVCEEESEVRKLWVCPSELAGYWKFDDKEEMLEKGIIRDSSGNFFDGVFTGSGGVPQSKWIVDGRVGNALNFDPSFYHTVSIPHLRLLDPGQGDFSISVWIRPSLNRIDVFPVNKGHWYWVDSYYIGIGKSDFIFGLTDKELSSGIVSKAKIRGGIYQTDEWYHVVGVRDTFSDKINLYVNGQKVSESDDTTTDILTRVELTFGKDSSFRGFIDEVAIFKKALSQEEVLDLFNEGSGKEICYYE